MKRTKPLAWGNLISILLIVITAALITWTGIVYQQEVFRIIPLYVSLVVGMLQARASRYACLIGSLNSILYAAVYFSFALYASAAYALLISFPLQAITFLRWRKRSYKHSTEFRRLSGKQWALVGGLFALSFALLYGITSLAGSGYRLLDNSVTLFGILISILTMLSFREYSWLMLISGSLTIALDARMTVDHPAQITYLIFALYSMTCIVRQFFAVRGLYKEQLQQRKEQSNENN